jgi:hypothetical protein
MESNKIILYNQSRYDDGFSESANYSSLSSGTSGILNIARWPLSFLDLPARERHQIKLTILDRGASPAESACLLRTRDSSASFGSGRSFKDYPHDRPMVFRA